MLSGDPVKFVYLTSQQYGELLEKDPATLYFIMSDSEKRIAIGDTMFANYVPAHCTALSLSTSSISLGVGENFTLTAYTEPASPSDALLFSATNQNVSLTTTSMSNKVVVTAQAVGTSSIVVTCGEFTVTCEVEIHRQWIYVDHILAENYSPNGAKFIYNAPITLTDGNYIEVSIDLSTITGTKENIISIGQNIDVWNGSSAGSHMMMYVTASDKSKISVDLIYNSKMMRPLYTLTGTLTLVIRLDASGVRLNGVHYLFDTDPRVTPTMTYEEGITRLTSLSSYDIGSQEGSNRSHAIYNYIKYVTTE